MSRLTANPYAIYWYTPSKSPTLFCLTGKLPNQQVPLHPGESDLPTEWRHGAGIAGDKSSHRSAKSPPPLQTGHGTERLSHSTVDEETKARRLRLLPGLPAHLVSESLCYFRSTDPEGNAKARY